MKKKFTCGMLIGTLIFSSVILTGCGSSSDIDKNTTTQEQNTATESNPDNSSANSNEPSDLANDPKDLNNSKSNNSDSGKDNSKSISSDENKKESSNSPKNQTENSKNIDKKTSSNTESSKSNSEANDSSNKNIDNSKNKVDSTNNDVSKDSSAKEANSLSMQQLADKIADFEYNGNVTYITPVRPIGSGKDLTYEEDSSSNIFFCSDDKFDSKNLKYGTLINLFGYDKESDSYSFRVCNYEYLKNEGTGTIDYGTVTSKGKINSANVN